MAPQHDHRTPGGSPDDDVETGRRLFDRMRRTGLVRADEGWFGGVAGLVAERLRWDATLVRGLIVVLAIVTFPPLALIYGLLWILLPDGDGRIHLQQGVRGDFSSGLLGGGVLTLIGALGLLSPFNLTGAAGIALNVLVLLGLMCLVIVAVRGSRRRKKTSSDTRPAPEADETAPDRTDGKPAWYPRTHAPTATQPTAPQPQPGPHHTAPYPTPQGSTTTSRRTAKPTPSPAEREARRRRRLLTAGALLLAVPVALGLLLLGGGWGFPAVPTLLTVTAVLVLLLACHHIIAALRGRRGRGFLLGTLTVVMLGLFAITQSEVRPTDGSHAFGSYSTDSDSVSSAFSATTVDLRRLEPSEASTIDGVEVHTAEVNNAFGSMTIIVPDDVEVVLDVNQAFGSMSTHTIDGEQDYSGPRTDGPVLGPEDADQRLEVSVNAAFNSLDVYDATTYAEEFGDDVDSGEGR